MIGKVVRAGVQSGTIMSVADALTQVVIEGKTLPQPMSSLWPPKSSSSTTTDEMKDSSSVEVLLTTSYDPVRTLRWTLAGLMLHGPYFFVGFAQLDRAFGPATSMAVVLKKTAAAQFILFPPYLVALFSFMGVMEQGGWNKDTKGPIREKVRQRVPEAFLGGCIFWPVANAINFGMIPTAYRVPYLATAAGFWNSYLSWANARGNSSNSNKSQLQTNESKP